MQEEIFVFREETIKASKEKDDIIHGVLDDQALMYKNFTELQERMDNVDWQKVENAERIADKFK